MTCCLNPACHNPLSLGDRTVFCSNCGTRLVVLRNRYRPIKSLGGGGFGKTYLAEDIDKLNELCVIKQFAPQVQGTAALNKATELFEQEAKRLQQLGKHPQIPTLLAYFNEDNCLYLVQEFIEGQNLLLELQQQGTFNEQKARELLLDLLDILQTVHQQKVIHRDIKPENIIRRSDGKLVLIDFGASKQLTATAMTQIGTSIGSFGYASLEQMQDGEAYPASDLYSVGATCFHLLSGIHPRQLWQRQGYAWIASWRQYLQQPVSQELGQILDKLLHEEYQQRYQSAAEVLEALNSQPEPAIQPVAPLVTPPPAQKKSIPIRLLVIPLILLLGAGTVYFIGVTNPFKTAQEIVDSYYEEGLEKYNNKDFRGAIEDYTKVIKINPNAAAAYYNRGLAQSNLGDEQAAIEDYDRAIKINPRYSLAYVGRGLARSTLGDKQAAIEDYSQAIKIAPKYSLAYYNRGNARSALGDKQGAIEDYDRAIKINPRYPLAYNNRGNARSASGDKQGAIEDYDRAIKINPKYPLAYNNRGLARSALGDKQGAIEDYNQAIAINPSYALAYSNRGIAYSVLGYKQAAIEDFRKSADLYKQQGKESDYQDVLNRIQKLEK